MNRLALFVLLALAPFALVGCGRGAPDPTRPGADHQGPEVPDAKLQAIEEDEHRARETEANAAPPSSDPPAADPPATDPPAADAPAADAPTADEPALVQ